MLDYLYVTVKSIKPVQNIRWLIMYSEEIPKCTPIYVDIEIEHSRLSKETEKIMT